MGLDQDFQASKIEPGGSYEAVNPPPSKATVNDMGLNKLMRDADSSCSGYCCWLSGVPFPFLSSYPQLTGIQKIPHLETEMKHLIFPSLLGPFTVWQLLLDRLSFHANRITWTSSAMILSTLSQGKCWSQNQSFDWNVNMWQCAADVTGMWEPRLAFKARAYKVNLGH